MSVYLPDIETALDDDETFEADYNPCEEPVPPDLSGMSFQFVAAPKSGAGATITKNCTLVGTTIKWPLAAADKTGRLGEIFRCKLRRIDLGFSHRWAEFNLRVVD